MERLNITLPDDIAGYLNQKSNKSAFIAQVLREKMEQEKNEKLKKVLIEGYKISVIKNKTLTEELLSSAQNRWT